MGGVLGGAEGINMTRWLSWLCPHCGVINKDAANLVPDSLDSRGGVFYTCGGCGGCGQSSRTPPDQEYEEPLRMRSFKVCGLHGQYETTPPIAGFEHLVRPEYGKCYLCVCAAQNGLELREFIESGEMTRYLRILDVIGPKDSVGVEK